MNRIIKFRGQNKNDWHYGSYIFRDGKHFILIEDDDNGYYSEVEVKGETIGQYTGLKDKNGKEIYEEDILKSGVSDVICKINIGHYDDTSSSQHDIMGVWFNIVGEKKPYGFAKAVLTKDSCNIMEVIGNIYDNPELVN